MYDKIKKYQDHPFFKQFQDVRAVGLLIFGALVILVTWSGVGAVETNYNLQKQVSSLQQQNQLETLRNSNLSLQNEYYNTNEYLELQARQLFGKGNPGETLIIVPNSVAQANSINVPSQPTGQAAAPPQPAYERNFEAWINFFFHRS